MSKGQQFVLTQQNNTRVIILTLNKSLSTELIKINLIPSISSFWFATRKYHGNEVDTYNSNNNLVGKNLFKISKTMVEQLSNDHCSNVILLTLNRHLPSKYLENICLKNRTGAALCTFA